MAYLGEDRVAEFRAVFDVFDEDKDGLITIKEFGKMVKSIGQDPNEADFRSMLREMDVNKTGTLNFQQFCSVMSKKMKDHSEVKNELREAFKMFDKDGSGQISADEFKNLITQLGDDCLKEDEALEMFSLADVDGDGQIDYSEFLQLLG